MEERGKEFFLEHLAYEKLSGKLYWGKAAPGRKVGKEAGSVKQNGYRAIRLLGKNYLAHRIVWQIENDLVPKEIDHLNGLRTDNRISNLRDVSHQENQKNRTKNVNNTSGCCGVFFNSKRGNWRVRIQIDKKRKSFGEYVSYAEACMKAKNVFTEFGFTERHGGLNG